MKIINKMRKSVLWRRYLLLPGNPFCVQQHNEKGRLLSPEVKPYVYNEVWQISLLS